MRYARRNDLSAKHWHNRYLAWQVRVRKQKEESERLKEERKRIFGGDGNEAEDDGLCSRMMDYFVRLDYLEKWGGHDPIEPPCLESGHVRGAQDKGQYWRERLVLAMSPSRQHG